MPGILDFVNVGLTDKGKSLLVRKTEKFTPPFLEDFFPSKSAPGSTTAPAPASATVVKKGLDKKTMTMIGIGVGIIALLALMRR